MNAPHPDGELLTAFTGRADQTAFAALVERHGPMVVRVAEAILRDRHGAEDVAQAAFLVLARKAAGLRRSETVAPWLHRVTWRLAIDELRRRQSRQRREEENVRMNTPASPADLSAIHEELGGLPDRYRSALVVCYLEGEPQESAARRLGLSPEALRKRLERARQLLRKKLARRDVTVGSVGALTALLSAESGAAVLPATFVASTVSAATGGTVSTTVAALSQGALHAMFIAKIKTVSLTAAACVVVAGTGMVVAQQATQSPSSAQPRTGSAAALIATGSVAANGAGPATPQAAKPTTIATKHSETTLPVLQLSDLVRLSRGPNGLRAEWIGKTSPDQLGTFKTANPPLECSARIPTEDAGRCPGEFFIMGSNPAEKDGTGIWDLKLKGHGDYVWVSVGYGTQSPNAWVEYVQQTNSVLFIRNARLGGKVDHSQGVGVNAANLAELQAKMGDKLREYWAPVLALLTTQDLLGPGAGAGQGSKVFKPIDTTQSGTYGDGKWSYSYEVKGGHRQGFLKYDGREIGSPQPGDFLLTPWGWMHWQNSTWLPVPEKPAKGKQLPDPTTDASIVSRPPPASGR